MGGNYVCPGEDMTHDYGDNCTDILPRGRGWGGLYVNTHTHTQRKYQ